MLIDKCFMLFIEKRIVCLHKTNKMKELFKTNEAFEYLKSITIGLYDYEGMPMLDSNGKYADYTVLLTDEDVCSNHYSSIYDSNKIKHAFYLSLLDRFCCDDSIMIHGLVFMKSSLVVFSSVEFDICDVLSSRRRL